MGGDKFVLEEYKGLRNNELRAPKARNPSRLGGLRERRKLPSGVWGGAPASNAF